MKKLIFFLKFLASQGIMDYSLLLGFHFLDKKEPMITIHSNETILNNSINTYNDIKTGDENILSLQELSGYNIGKDSLLPFPFPYSDSSTFGINNGILSSGF